ncbi:FCD domain-containing protein [Glutamicibacter sp. JL.03c]|uniref:FadR/GntR family transcriptional regulator n=1 Tax=Glutamicibacter sp. JL.03c TaxID=2984842 RepID=UPI0021F6C7CC|nr:FCD domain-containing protein [Glutamicibacter sp. JL.03c]UYQ77759.1 FCD domain-containing protein [Glutamicibacter sp. JL.03c]
MSETPTMPKRSTLVPQVIEILQENISSGRWPIGSRLPLEAELLTQYKISRVTLRQAVQALVHVGMLETIQGSGTFVRASSELNTVLNRYLDNEHLSYVLEARLAIEAEAAELAATRATPDDLNAMADLLEKSRHAALNNDAEKLNLFSAKFHFAVVESAANPVLLELYRALEEGTARSLREISDHQPLVSFVDEHVAILESIRAGEGIKALAATREHLTAVMTQHASQSGAVSAITR